MDYFSLWEMPNYIGINYSASIWEGNIAGQILSPYLEFCSDRIFSLDALYKMNLVIELKIQFFCFVSAWDWTAWLLTLCIILWAVKK